MADSLGIIISMDTYCTTFATMVLAGEKAKAGLTEIAIKDVRVRPLGSLGLLDHFYPLQEVGFESADEFQLPLIDY